MSAEGTPFIAESEGTAVYVGTAVLNGESMARYLEPTELPCSEAKRAICENHLASGELQSEVLNDFWMGGWDIDSSLQEGVVRLQFTCPGRSGILKHCRLTLTQYDKAGNNLNSGTLNQKID